MPYGWSCLKMYCFYVDLAFVSTFFDNNNSCSTVRQKEKIGSGTCEPFNAFFIYTVLNNSFKQKWKKDLQHIQHLWTQFVANLFHPRNAHKLQYELPNNWKFIKHKTYTLFSFHKNKRYILNLFNFTTKILLLRCLHFNTFFHLCY